MIQFGASPRATIYLIECGRALAYLRGRDYVLPEDVTDVALDVLRHRVVLSYEAMAENLDTDEIVRRIMRRVAGPREGPRLACPHQRERLKRILRRLEWTVLRRLDGLLQGDYRSCFAARASIWRICASTRKATTCATSTGTSPRACRRCMCANTRRTASSRPGSCSI